MIKYLQNPFLVAGICMLLFAVMYNSADSGFLRACSYVPLAVVAAIFLKGVYYAYFRRS